MHAAMGISMVIDNLSMAVTSYHDISTKLTISNVDLTEAAKTLIDRLGVVRGTIQILAKVV